MPFQIVRDDITHISADAIVNSANPRAVIGGGVDSAIHMAAGPRLIEARKRIGDIAEGDVRYSRAFDLRARYVLHAVGPDCRKEQPDMEGKLHACYAKSLQIAKRLGCESIAFPLISAGIYDCPKEQAMQIAVSAISEFLMQNDMDVTLVVYDPESYVLSTKLFHDVKAYVDEHYVESAPKDSGISELDHEDLRRRAFLPNSAAGRAEAQRRRDERESARRTFGEEEVRLKVGSIIQDATDGEEDVLSTTDFDIQSKIDNVRWSIDSEDFEPKEIKPNGETFTQMLLRLIDQTGKKDSEVYLKAGQTRQLFHKIRNQRNYQPNKNTVISFAIALELNMDQTLDLLKTAGYTLSDGIKMDVAIQYFIEKEFYNLMEIKSILFGLEIEFR